MRHATFTAAFEKHGCRIVAYLVRGPFPTRANVLVDLKVA